MRKEPKHFGRRLSAGIEQRRVSAARECCVQHIAHEVIVRRKEQPLAHAHEVIVRRKELRYDSPTRSVSPSDWMEKCLDLALRTEEPAGCVASTIDLASA